MDGKNLNIFLSPPHSSFSNIVGRVFSPEKSGEKLKILYYILLVFVSLNNLPIWGRISTHLIYFDLFLNLNHRSFGVFRFRFRQSLLYSRGRLSLTVVSFSDPLVYLDFSLQFQFFYSS